MPSAVRSRVGQSEGFPACALMHDSREVMDRKIKDKEIYIHFEKKERGASCTEHTGARRGFGDGVLGRSGRNPFEQ